MTDADKAFETAREMIAEAKREGLRLLDFDKAETRALTRLPDEIAELDELQVLILRNTNLREVGAISGLKNLTEINLNMTGLREVVFLTRLTNVAHLYLRYTKVRDIDPLSGLNRLRKLDLSHTQVFDLTALSNATALTHLYLANSRVEDLRPLSTLNNLKTLLLDRTQVRDLRPLLSLRPLVEGPEALTLGFRRTVAAKQDPAIENISRIKDKVSRAETLFEYLQTWEPPPDLDDIPPQSDKGLRYRIGEVGQVGYDRTPPDVPPDADMEVFHGLLREAAGNLGAECGTGRNQMYGPLAELLARYLEALADGPGGMSAPLVWKYGNDLRTKLASNEARSLDGFEDMPPLGVDMRDDLAGIVSTHNVFVGLHPDLTRFDMLRADSATRHQAAEAGDKLEAALAALTEQVALLETRIAADLEDLHREAAGAGEAAARAMVVEQESFENLIKVIVAEAVAEAQGGSFGSKIAGDARAAAVGTVIGGTAAALGPQVAATYPDLVATLQPYVSAVLAAWKGEDYPLTQAMNWVTSRVRNPQTKDPDEL